MNFDSLQSMWGRQAVAPATFPTDAMLREFKRDIATAERRVRGVLVLAAGCLALEWIFAVAGHVTGIKVLNAVQVIGHVVASALLSALFARALASLRTLRAERLMLGGTVRESTAATLRVIEVQIGNARLAAVAVPLVVLGWSWLIVAKYLAGNLPWFGAAAGIGFAAVMGAAIGGAIWHRYRTRLLPRRAELQAALASLAER